MLPGFFLAPYVHRVVNPFVSDDVPIPAVEAGMVVFVGVLMHCMNRMGVDLCAWFYCQVLVWTGIEFKIYKCYSSYNCCHYCLC